MLRCNRNEGRVVVEAFESVAAVAFQPASFAVLGLAATLMFLVRRSGQGRRRTD
jgi:hypothetical protein